MVNLISSRATPSTRRQSTRVTLYESMTTRTSKRRPLLELNAVKVVEIATKTKNVAASKRKRTSITVAVKTKKARVASRVVPAVEVRVEKFNNSALKELIQEQEKTAAYTWGNKPFLTCGLYGTHPKKRGKTTKSQNALPLPLYHGNALLSEQRDFELPFDIYEANRLGLIESHRRPDPYIKLRTNVFVERRKLSEDEFVAVCSCNPPSDGLTSKGCGDDCINRMMQYECSPRHCPAGDSCSNQPFRNNEGVKDLQVFWANEKGFALRTKVDIKADEFIIEYKGEIVSLDTCFRRIASGNNRHFYFLDYDEGEVIDATNKGSDARFISHSCAANCVVQKWLSPCREYHLGIFAKRDIKAGEEITYDYNFTPCAAQAETQKCHCGAETCRGFLGKPRKVAD